MGECGNMFMKFDPLIKYFNPDNTDISDLTAMGRSGNILPEYLTWSVHSVHRKCTATLTKDLIRIKWPSYAFSSRVCEWTRGLSHCQTENCVIHKIRILIQCSGLKFCKPSNYNSFDIVIRTSFSNKRGKHKKKK